MTRRAFLGAGAVVAGGVLLAACGGGGASSGTTSATPTGKPRRGGTFRVGLSDSSASDSLDAAQAYLTYTNNAISTNLYDTLVENDLKTTNINNSLAEEFELAPDFSYITIRVRKANFHDGKPVTADDVMFTLKRNLDPKTGSSVAPFLTSVDPNHMVKMDTRTVRVYLKSPDWSVPQGFSITRIVPVDYDPKKPVGTGPFVVKSFNPGVRTVFTRNDNYWRSGLPYLDQLELVGFSDPDTTRTNALLSGQIDAANLVSFSQVPSFSSDSNVALIISPSHAYNTWEMRMDKPPFTDVRVRQAIKLIADRPQIVEVAYGGSRYAVIANDAGVTPTDPTYDHSIPQRTQDIEQAKSLLKQAGQENLNVTLIVSRFAEGIVETATALAQQAKAAGVTIKINNIADSSTYLLKDFVPAPFKMDFFQTTRMYEWINPELLPGGIYYASAWRDPQWLDLVNAARRATDVNRRNMLLGDAQKIFWDSGTQAVFAYYRSVDAYNKKFGGLTSAADGAGLHDYRFRDVFEA